MQRLTIAYHLAVVTAVLSLVAVPALADPVAEFYKDRSVTYIQASSASGGYAAYSRLVAKHLPRFIPGNPTIQLQFMAGAGGVKGANYVYNVAAKDGSVIGMPLNSVAANQVTCPKSVRYDAARFAWFAGLSPLNSVIAVWHTAPATTLAVARITELVIGATAKSADNYQQPALAKGLLGLNFKLVTGYGGSQDLDLAMERGETHGRMSFWESWTVTRPDWIRDRKVIPLVQVGARPIKDLPGVPRLIDLVASDDDKAMVRLLHVSAAIGRSVYGPPGIPGDRRATLRRAVEAMSNDPAFLKEAAERSVEMEPSPGQEIEDLMAEALRTPAAMVERYKTAVELE